VTGDIERLIRERAYEIWESEGRPQGRSDDHWKQARAEFSEASAEATQPAKGRKPGGSGEARTMGRGRSAATTGAQSTGRASTGRATASKSATSSRRKKPET
jgi:hypothetical protein